MRLFSRNTRRATARRLRFSTSTCLQQLELLETRTLLAAFSVNTDQDVTSPDDNLLSLREAVVGVNSSSDPTNTIEFALPETGNTISLTQGTLQLLQNVTIVGLGAGNLTVQRSSAEGTPRFGIFYVGSIATVEIFGLTIAGGKSDGWGGGILNDGTLVIANSTLSGNSGSIGGAISNQGLLTVSNSNLSRNSASHGGAIRSGAIWYNRLGGHPQRY